MQFPPTADLVVFFALTGTLAVVNQVCCTWIFKLIILIANYPAWLWLQPPSASPLESVEATRRSAAE